jgi:hypothetical protein
MKKIICVLSLLILNAGTISAEGFFSGLVFGDYYWIAANHNQAIEDLNGFRFRRIYFTYDTKRNESFKTRLRFEMQSSGDFAGTLLLEAFVKDAYISWLSKKQKVILGLSKTPTIEFVQKSWGYRHLEQTPVDFQRLAISRDLGVAVKGDITWGRKIKYHLMFANGDGIRSEIDKGKVGYLSLRMKKDKDMTVELYGDYGVKDSFDRVYTLQLFTLFEKPVIAIGSIFLIYDIANDLKLVTRYDRTFDPNPAGAAIRFIPFSPLSESNFILVGIDIAKIENISLIPNIEAVIYDDRDIDSDLILRITFFSTF